MGPTNNELCLVKSMVIYLARCNTGAGLLFIYNNGKALTQEKFVGHLQGALRRGLALGTHKHV